MKSKTNSTIADSVERSIIQYVHSEKLSPGDPLPKEEEFAAKLNVSRHSVREGISGLKILGVIESRKRRGMVLKEQVNCFEGVRKLADAKLFSDSDKENFMDLYAIVVMGILENIWNNRTPDDLQELKSIAQNTQLSNIDKELDNLILKESILGKQTNTKVSLLYMNNIANKKLVKDILSKINKILSFKAYFLIL